MDAKACIATCNWLRSNTSAFCCSKKELHSTWKYLQPKQSLTRDFIYISQNFSTYWFISFIFHPLSVYGKVCLTMICTAASQNHFNNFKNYLPTNKDAVWKFSFAFSFKSSSSTMKFWWILFEIIKVPSQVGT